MKTQACSYCKAPITCKANDITNCDCQSVNLLPETVHFLQTKTNHNCLCNACLHRFDQWVQFGLNNPFPARMSQMQPVHFYTENGFFVFTEQYHVHKGYCCENNCRHCVYQSKI
ncbi:cysteine-rich CWC family protein [Flavobacterium agricola]|uniref:Cysteine-rich CWC family protein n=1 Tax=Flavobacterium agricola TaxID=2870839 RepID=A0ABY6LY77_9FLAO|nr:cysteine-rich CWC family protein [Flavobacterium agricola]UYW01294.1 cysteine-rich CWC family protein [Flavobacterium agricola]